LRKCFGNIEFRNSPKTQQSQTFEKKYRLRYLPLFYEDLDEKVTYILEKLKNPKAANDLLDNVEAAMQGKQRK
jgi:hypothetical protein